MKAKNVMEYGKIKTKVTWVLFKFNGFLLKIYGSRKLMKKF